MFKVLCQLEDLPSGSVYEYVSIPVAMSERRNNVSISIFSFSSPYHTLHRLAHLQ